MEKIITISYRLRKDCKGPCVEEQFQASDVAKMIINLAKDKTTVILTSPQECGRQTAKTIGKQLGVKPVFLETLANTGKYSENFNNTKNVIKDYETAQMLILVTNIPMAGHLNRYLQGKTFSTATSVIPDKDANGIRTSIISIDS